MNLNRMTQGSSGEGPEDWIGNVQRFFANLNEQSPDELLATFEAAKFLTIGTPEGVDPVLYKRRLNAILGAIAARVVIMIEESEDEEGQQLAARFSTVLAFFKKR